MPHRKFKSHTNNIDSYDLLNVKCCLLGMDLVIAFKSFCPEDNMGYLGNNNIYLIYFLHT